MNRTKTLKVLRNNAWNLRVTVEAVENEGFRVTTSPLSPTPHFLRQEPREFSTREAAMQTARAIAGV